MIKLKLANERKILDVSDTFISKYLQHTSIYESPGSFWKWSAYSAISAVLNERAFIKTGDSFIFPNLYVLFLAESSIHRKGKPVDLSESLVSAVSKLKIISGRASVQAILDELARTETDPNTGKVVKSSSAIFYAPELAAAIVSDMDGMGILTDIYDYKTNPYKSRLRTGPCFNLERVVFSIMGATNEDMIRKLFDAAVIKGGFLARTLLIVPNEFRDPNSLLRIDHEKHKLSKVAVVEKLHEIAKVVGEMKVSEEAIDEHEAWYNPFKREYERKKEASGIIGRIHTHILKLSMVLAANDLSNCIQRRHMEEAINECLVLIPNYSIFTLSHGRSELSQLGGYVITDLSTAENHMLSTKELIRAHWQDGLDPDTLEKLMITLENAGLLVRHEMHGGTHLALTKQCLNMLNGGVSKK